MERNDNESELAERVVTARQRSRQHVVSLFRLSFCNNMAETAVIQAYENLD